MTSKGLAPPLTIDQIRVPRSVEGFFGFMSGVRDAVRRLSHEDKHSWWQQKDRAAKRYFHEVIPVEAFLKAEEIALGTRVSVPCDYGPADATLHNFRTDGSDQPLQITTASWHHDDALRLEYMSTMPKNRRFVGMDSQMSRDPKTGRLTELRDRPFDRQKVCDEIKRSVCKGIKKKIGKFETSNYGPRSWLIVQMADPWMTDGFRAGVCSVASEASAGAPFERVYVVSPNDPVFSGLVWLRAGADPSR